MSGYGLKKNQALSIILENDLKETGYNIRVINGSVSGNTSEDGLDRIEEYVSNSDIDLIVLGLGANDMLRRIDPNQTENNLRKIIEIIKVKNIKIILAGMKASPTNGSFNGKGSSLLLFSSAFNSTHKNITNKNVMQLNKLLVKLICQPHYC